MKLYEIINTLQQISSAQPSVNNVFEGDVYQLNELKDIKYGAIVITQGTHRSANAFRYFRFTIFYVDRLTEDRSNKVLIQSTALDTLANIILAMDEMGFDFNSVNYHPFTQRFEAECAGAYADVEFIAPEELCADWYDIIISNIRAAGNGYSILDEYAQKTWVLEQLSGGTGQQGPQGATGAQGSMGEQGPQGAVGAQGSKGEDGMPGAQGSIGERGIPGVQGDRGVQGSAGAQGNAGAQGDTGAQGPQGAVGPQGATGSVIGAVTSSTIECIWTGPQAAYELIDPKLDNTLYFING